MCDEWVRGVCEKPRVKCAECHHRRFLPVTDDIIRWHLSGHDDAGQPFVAGVYPILQNEIYVPTDGLLPGLRNRLIRIAPFQNPEFYKAQVMRLPTFDTPRVIACAEQHPHHLGLPRGCLTDLRNLLDDLKVALLVRDERRAGQPLDVAFHGELRPEQKAAAKALLVHDIGVLSATATRKDGQRGRADDMTAVAIRLASH